MAFGVLQIDPARFPAVQQAAFAFVYDIALHRQVPIRVDVQASGVNELIVKLICPGEQTSVDPALAGTCINLPAIPSGPAKRHVAIYIGGLAFLAGEKPFTQFVTVPVEKDVPMISKTDIAPEGNTIPIGVYGMDRATFLQIVTPQLTQVKARLDFAPSDYLPAISLTPTAIAASTRGGEVLLILPNALPKRPEAYTLKVIFPVSLFPPNANISSDLTASYSFEKATFPAVEEEARKKVSFWVDATYRSFVDPIVNKGNRRNSGLFSYAWRPILASLPSKSGRTVYSVRPTLSANVSTDPLRELVKSGAPTQLQHGIDLEIIRNHFEKASEAHLYAQSLFTVGLRHESDRDLKFQTIFARFGYSPIFLGWHQSREYRAAMSPAGKSQRVSMWGVQPTFSLDRGAVVRDRLQRLIPYPLIADTLSRANIELAAEVEFARAIRLTVKDTYSYLWYLPRRPNRNFASATMELNSGYLFHTSPLSSIQNALVLKFERGEQTPTYKPVNSFSVGFKIYH